MKMSNKQRTGKYIRFVLMFGVMLLLFGCTQVKDVEENHKIKVVTTIFPPYDFVRQIAGDNVEVTMLLKPGEETHSYEPTPQDILQIQQADVFIYTGGENDVWVEDILDSIHLEGKEMIAMVDCVETLEEEHVEGMKDERGHNHTLHDHEHEHEEEHEHTVDEHVWTSPQNAEKIVVDISTVLQQKDKENALLYKENTEKYLVQLKELDEEFREVVENSKNHVLLFGDRFPFRYFAEEYNLDYYAAFPGCASDTEPSAATMAFLINQVKEKNIPVVLKMELSNDDISKAIAEATGTKVRTFYSCHNLTAKEFQAGETYLSMMRKNVETLKEVLGGWH
ncbi:MAG: metal ABC transporter substrate-binding protein [Candidatus Ruminococcus intestinipullorum]|nr:metal ABC transporter substrate-binding protein [Candidatus Ruminococcus intestinipullorum]